MDWRRRLLWIDCSGAAVVGIVVVLLSGWLSELHRLPRDFLLFIGCVNLGYGAYSFSLARRGERPIALIRLLVVANLLWTVLCMRWTWIFFDTASIFGLLHIAGEGVYVGVLAGLEWRWRELLRKA